jgi:hypothetical protein
MKRMIRSEMRKKEKTMICFEVIQIFDEEILLEDETINQDESILKISFLNFDDDQEILHIHKALISEIYFEIFDDKKQKLKKNQNLSLQI